MFAIALGYAHSNIPLAAFTIKALGDRTAGSSTTGSNLLDGFTANYLAQYDAIVLDNTTDTFLDNSDAPATEARLQALLSFIRGGVLHHAAGDSYYSSGLAPCRPGDPRPDNP